MNLAAKLWLIAYTAKEKHGEDYTVFTPSKNHK